MACLRAKGDGDLLAINHGKRILIYPTTPGRALNECCGTQGQVRGSINVTKHAGVRCGAERVQSVAAVEVICHAIR